MTKSLLVDFSTLSVAAAFASGIENTLDEGFLRHLILNSILGARRRFKDYEMVLAIDGRDYWRKNIFPHYKASRAKSREESDFDWARFYQQRDGVINEIKQVFPYKVIKIDEAEADDIIGVLALNATDACVIYAEDNDFKQCARNPHVRLFSPRQQKFKTDLTLYEVEYELFHKICTGDGGDGIPNIFSASDTFVRDGVRQTPARKKKIDEFFESGVYDQFKDRFNENQSLIDFRYIPVDLKERIWEAYAQPPLGSKGKIWNYLTSKELVKISNQFMSDIDSF